MNIQTEINENHQALITVELDTENLDRKKQQAAKKLARNAHIPGFRPGKAPFHMIVRHLGEGRILEEAVEGMIDEIYPTVLNESGVKPYGPGKLENLKLEDTDTPTAQFLVSLAPEVELGDFQSIRLPFEMPEVTEEKVERTIQAMREMYAEVELVERPAEETDLVNIVLAGKLPDAEEGKFYIDHESYPVMIESESEEAKEEWPFPGFSQTLIGLSAGEKKSTSYTYPEDYEEGEVEEDAEGAEDKVSLKGKTVTFEIEVVKVNSRTVPALDEEFIKKMGEAETLEEFQEATRKRLTEANESEYNEGYEERLLEELLKVSTIKYPQEAVDDEVKLVFNRLKNRLENQGIGFDIYLKAVSTTEEAILEQLRPGSEKRLKESLVLMEIAEKENIQVDQDEVQHELEHTLGHLMSGMSERDARRSFTDDVLRGLTANIYNNNLIANTLKHLRAMASGELAKQAELSIETSTDEALREESSESPIQQEETPVDQPATGENTPEIEAAVEYNGRPLAIEETVAEMVVETIADPTVADPATEPVE